LRSQNQLDPSQINQSEAKFLTIYFQHVPILYRKHIPTTDNERQRRNASLCHDANVIVRDRRRSHGLQLSIKLHSFIKCQQQWYKPKWMGKRNDTKVLQGRSLLTWVFGITAKGRVVIT
jgi:hypothetical protein